jgi:hypothetical protein
MSAGMSSAEEAVDLKSRLVSLLLAQRQRRSSDIDPLNEELLVASSAVSP